MERSSGAPTTVIWRASKNAIDLPQILVVNRTGDEPAQITHGVLHPLDLARVAAESNKEIEISETEIGSARAMTASLRHGLVCPCRVYQGD